MKTSGIGTRGGGREVNDDEIKMKRLRSEGGWGGSEWDRLEEKKGITGEEEKGRKQEEEG